MIEDALRRIDLAKLSGATEGDEEKSIIVEKLSEDEPDYQTEWDKKKNDPEVTLTYRLKSSLPPGIPIGFIGRSHRYTTHTHWRYGALLVDTKDRQHLGLIRANDHERYVALRVRGPYPHTFFALLKDGLELTLNRYPGLEMQRMIPCPGHDGIPCEKEFEYEELLKRLGHKRTIECTKTMEDISVQQLLFGIPENKDPIARQIQTSPIASHPKREPINALIEQQLSRLVIDSYRRFKGLELNQLARINIITGGNNAGKTTVLEAIQLLAHQNDPNTLLESLSQRGKLLAKPKGDWLVSQIQPITLSAIFDQRKVSFRVAAYDAKEQDKVDYHKSYHFNTTYGTMAQNADLHLFQDHWSIRYESSGVLCRTAYSSPFAAMLEQHRQGHEASLRAGSKQKIIAFLKKHLFPELKYIEYSDRFQRFVVTLDSGQTRELTDFGEGMQRSFLTSLLFAYAENGMLLIDELENGLHTSLLPHFSSFIRVLAREYKVQVFFTTHSKECVDAFFVDEDELDDVCVFTLMDDEAQIADRIGGIEFKQLLKAGNFDARLCG